jgi:hypothetical protein
MLAFANVVDLLTHKLARLSRGGFALALVLTRPCDRFYFWHGLSLSC